MYQGILLLRLFILPFLIVCLAGLEDCFAAERPKEGRRSSDWAQAGASELLTNSPWSMPVAAAMDDPADRFEPSAAPLPGAAQAGMPGTAGSAAGQTRWDGGVGKNRMGRLPTIPVTVRWESAAIVQSALKQTGKPSTGSVLEGVPKDFILEVTGLIPAHRYRTQTLVGTRKSSSGDTADPTDPEEVLESFMANSRLSWKGISEQPENVRLDADTGAIHIFFPRTDLSPKNKEVVFSTSFGSMHTAARFRIKDMLIQGKPDL